MKRSDERYDLPQHHIVVIAAGSSVSIRAGETFRTCVVRYGEARIKVFPPIRISALSRRQIPQLSPENIGKVLRVESWPSVPVNGMSVNIDPKGVTTLSIEKGRDIPHDDNHPDAFKFMVLETADAAQAEVIAKRFSKDLFEWLRAETGQYWIGRGWEIGSFVLASFPVDRSGRNNYVGHFGSPPFYFPQLYFRALTNALFKACIDKVARGERPNPLDMMLMDFDYFQAAALQETSVVQGCSIIELARDRLMERRGVGFGQMKTGSNDLLKHLSRGFERVFGRDLSVDRPDDFETLTSMWIVRGHLAHGKSLEGPSLASHAEESFAKMGNAVRAIVTWIDSIS